VPTVEVRLEPEDYVKASKAVSQLSWRSTRNLVAVCGLALLAAAYFAVVDHDTYGALLTCCAAMGAVIGVLVVKVITIPRKARRVFAQTPALQRPYQVAWDDQAVTSTNLHGTGTYPWAEFHKSRELPDMFLVFFSDVMFIMVPKRAFPDDATLQHFRDSIQTHVRPAQK
jgi:hypothetical protein